MGLKQQIEQDLKTAMLAGDKELSTTLRGLKSAILYEEVAKAKRDVGLSDDEIAAVLSKESKKRQESAELYSKGGNNERASAELEEKAVIERYLPSALTEDQLNDLIDRAEAERGKVTKQNMGQVIGWVKAESKGAADGAKIAELVKARIENA